MKFVIKGRYHRNPNFWNSECDFKWWEKVELQDKDLCWCEVPVNVPCNCGKYLICDICNGYVEAL